MTEDMPAGQTPHTVVVFAHGDLVDKVQPGDRVTVTGIYRAAPLRDNPRLRNVKAVYKTHIDVVHYRKFDAKRLHIIDDEQGWVGGVVRWVGGVVRWVGGVVRWVGGVAGNRVGSLIMAGKL